MRSDDTQEHDHERATDNDFFKHRVSIRELIIILSSIGAVAFTVISHDIRTQDLVPRVQALEDGQREIEMNYVTRDDFNRLVQSLNTQSRNIVRIGEKLGVNLEAP